MNLINEPLEVLFADCFEDEFAVSSPIHFRATSDIIAYQSFPIASETDDLMTWIAVVENTGSDNRAASIGVICAGENDGDDDDESKPNDKDNDQ